MGLQALTHDDNGDPVVPESEEDWQDWVSATATRNDILNDPLVDWLALYGKDQGFLPDNELDGYDERTDFGRLRNRAVQRSRLQGDDGDRPLPARPPLISDDLRGSGPGAKRW